MQSTQKNESTIDPNIIPSRDYNMLLIINGATKSAIHTDRRKEQNKKACRNWRKGMADNDE